MKIERIYLVYFMVFALLVFINQGFIQFSLNKKERDAKTINIAGRQRMLSQKLNLFYFIAKENPQYHDSVVQIQALWTNSHNALLNGSTALALPAVEDKEARKILNELTPIIAYNEKTIAQGSYRNKAIFPIINKKQAIFLKKMDTAVRLLEIEAQNKLRFVIIMEIILAVLSIIVLYIEFKFLINPLIGRFKEKNQVLKRTNTKLEKAVFLQSHIIREPLTSLMMLIGVIKNEKSTDGKIQYLNHLDQLTQKIDNSIRQVVKFINEQESHDEK